MRTTVVLHRTTPPPPSTVPAPLAPCEQTEPESVQAALEERAAVKRQTLTAQQEIQAASSIPGLKGKGLRDRINSLTTLMLALQSRSSFLKKWIHDHSDGIDPRTVIMAECHRLLELMLESQSDPDTTERIELCLDALEMHVPIGVIQKIFPGEATSRSQFGLSEPQGKSDK